MTGKREKAPMLEVSAALRSRLRDRMRESGMSAKVLARRARADEAGVVALVLGTKTRIARDELDRIAAALGADAEWLATGAAAPTSPAGTTPGSGRSRAAWKRTSPWILSVLPAAVLVIVAGGAWLLRDAARVDAVFTCRCEHGTVEARNARDAERLWHVSTGAMVAFCATGPWRDDPLALYGLRPFHTTGGRIIVRDLARGDSLWSYTPDTAPVADLYPDDITATGAFNPNASYDAGVRCDRITFADFDGDEDEDVALRWQWDPWYPSLVEWLVRDRARPGHFRRRGAYYTCGRVQSVRAVDLDRDGRAELLCAGTNNALAYQGAMIILLDAEHWSGASADSLAMASHWRSRGATGDSCRARVVFPAMDAAVMAFLGVQRLDVVDVAVREGREDGTIDAVIGGDGHNPMVDVTLDKSLAPRSVRVNTEFRERLAGAPADVRAAFTEDALAAWLAKHRRFGAGPGGPGNAR